MIGSLSHDFGGMKAAFRPVASYNKVTEVAAKGNLEPREILAKASEIAQRTAASKQGPGRIPRRGCDHTVYAEGTPAMKENEI